MANDHSNLPLMSAEELMDEDFLRNCPTPDLTTVGLSDYIGSFDKLDFDSNSEIMNLFPNLDDITTNNSSPVTLGNQQGNSNVVTPNALQSSFYEIAPQSTSSFINSNANSPFSFLQNNDTIFMPIQAGGSREEDQTPIMFDKSDTIKNGGGSKEKCMTRNAILARQNREKKKTEQRSLNKKLVQLEEENASLRKERNEYKNNLENAQQRITYLEAILQNLPQIVNIVEHMSSYPTNKGANSNKKT